MLDFVRDLYPVCRSITGEGVRETLRRMQSLVPLEITEVPSGTKVFDWTVPKEWNIRAAYLTGPGGKKIVDFKDHSLHVMSYSTPVDAELSLDELEPHLHSLPEQPDLIPYRTSYYNENWAFCLSHAIRRALPDGRYHAFIDADLCDGSLTLGELLVPGHSAREMLVYSHVCHPSLANDNLSGLAVTVWWAKHLLENGGNRLSYRFVWGPGTIGSITWLARNEPRLANIDHGLVAVLLGRPGRFHYKKSRRGDTEIDRIAAHVLRPANSGLEIRDFDPYGYDERQFCSPGIDLAAGRLSRVPHGEYAEYHTSGDDLELISEDTLSESLTACIAISDALDRNRIFVNQSPKGEPQLGKRGLFRKTGGDNPKQREYALLWVLNLSDGEHSLLDIAERSGLPFSVIADAAAELAATDLLEERLA
jgi:aminopeptidase-like protein